MVNNRLQAYLAIASLAFVISCKEKDAPAVVEELPPAPEVQNTDTSAVMQEEPALSQVGGSASAKSGRSTFQSPDAGGFVKNGRYVVQVSVFKSSHKASLAVEKLAAQGYPAYVAEVEDPSPEMAGTWHRVRVGGFPSLSAARSFGENTLKPLGYDFWVDKKSMDNVGARGGSDSYAAPSTSSSSTPEPSSSSSYSAPTPEPTPTPSPAPTTEVTPSTPEPAAQDWGSANPATPEPPAPTAVQGWDAPAEPAPTNTQNWGTTSEPAKPTPDASSAPADTGTVKLDDW